MAKTVKEATVYIEQGRINDIDIKVGIETITDPCYFVTRTMEDLVSWVKESKLRQKILNYEGKRDDYENIE